VPATNGYSIDVLPPIIFILYVLKFSSKFFIAIESSLKPGTCENDKKEKIQKRLVSIYLITPTIKNTKDIFKSTIFCQ